MAGLDDTRTMLSAPAGPLELAETAAPSQGGDASSGDPSDPQTTLASAATQWGGQAPRDGDAGDPPRIGRFVVLREIGRGAMGVVYAAYDDELDRRVALKLVQTSGHDDPSFGRNQLLREAQALARLAHPNVVAVHEAGVFHGAVFIAMEFVDGVDLQRWLAAAPRTWREKVGVFCQAGEGLRAAHAVGMVHRDFKPGNVLVGADGRVRVADFGLATRRGRTGLSDHVSGDRPLSLSATEAAATLAVSGALIGTPAYMAPEQLRCEPATAASDQFAFCVALYEALYDARPFGGDSLAALAEQVLDREPPPPPPDAGVPPWLHAVLVRGLAKDPAQRFSGMDELLATLARDPEAERQRRRQRLLQLAVAVAATVVLVLGGVYVYRALVRAAHEQRAEARLEVLREQLAGLGARGRKDEAARLFAAFVDLPDNRGTAALVRAFREWGAAQTDDDAAIDAHAGEYIAARTREDQASALRSLALRLARSGAVAESSAALAALDARAPELDDDPELTGLRIAAALDRHDLPAARRALLRLPDGDPNRTYGHVLDHLSKGRVIERAAIGQGPGQPPTFSPADIDGDGRLEFATSADLRGSVVVLRADPALTRIAERPAARQHTAPRPLPRALAGAPLLLLGARHDGDHGLVRYGLFPLDDGPPVFEWDDSELLAWKVADLDRDGAPELYTGSGAHRPNLRQIRRGPDGRFTGRPAHPPTDAVQSDIHALAAGDLDRDGRPELVVAVGPWSAYDLRVLRADDAGELRMVARRTFGAIPHVALVRGGDEVLIAIAKSDAHESKDRFSEAAPFGEPAGIYLLGLRGEALETRQFFPFPPGGAGPRDYSALIAVDLDGDGRDDLVACARGDLAIARRHDDRFLDPLWLRGVHPLAAADFDGDPRGEILAVLDRDPERYVLLGVGDERVPARPTQAPAARPIREDLADPAVLDAWRHAEELAALGLARRSADELAAIARLSGHAREDMLFRAAELYSGADEHAAAAELFLAAADRPDLAVAALTGAIRSRRALGEFAAAESLAAVRAAAPGLPPAVRAEAETELAALRQATAERPELALRFDRPLDPRWHIVDPLAAAREPGTDALSFQTSPDQVVAEFPLEWDGGSAALTVDVALDHLDPGSELVVAVTPADSDDVWLGVRFEARGSADRPDLQALAVTGPGGKTQDFHVAPPVRPGLGRRFRIGFHHFPALAAALREFTPEDQPTERRLVSASVVPRAPEPGPVRLRLLGKAIDPDMVAAVRIFGVDLVGLRPGAAPPGEDATREVSRMIAEYELVRALDHLTETPAGSPQALWRADLLARLGRLDDSAAAIRSLLADVAADHEIHLRLRQRLVRDPDTFTLAARKALGPALYDLLADMDRGETTWRPARVRFHLSDLAALPTRPPPASAGPDAYRYHCKALFLRGLAWSRAGRDDLAVRDLEALVPLLDDAQLVEFRRHVLRRLIDAAIRLRDAKRAKKWIAAALTESASDLLLESIRRRPGVESLLTPGDWNRLEALARG